MFRAWSKLTMMEIVHRRRTANIERRQQLRRDALETWINRQYFARERRFLKDCEEQEACLYRGGSRALPPHFDWMISQAPPPRTQRPIWQEPRGVSLSSQFSRIGSTSVDKGGTSAPNSQHRPVTSESAEGISAY